MIGEWLDTGAIGSLETLRARWPPGAVKLRSATRLSERQVAALAEAGIEDLAALRAAASDGSLDAVPGFGPARSSWLRGRLAARDTGNGWPIGRARPEADALCRRVARDADRVVVAGALRRFEDRVPGIALVAAVPQPAGAVESFATSALLRSAATAPGRAEGVTHEGIPAALASVTPERFGTALVEATGSSRHLDQLGPLPASADEDLVYADLGLPTIAPELRQGTGEVEAARTGRLPALVTPDDLRGDLHLHSDLSGDGRMTITDICEGAVQRGYEYVAITDHAEDLRISGVDRDQMLAQRARIAALRSAYPALTILHGAELNIGPEGDVDYDPDFLAGYDWTVASVHSHFDLDRASQTRRLVTAMRNPAVSCIGHLTGRRLGHRPGISFEPETVFAAAASTRTALEVNGHMDRLDLPAAHIRAALQAGAVLALNSDAHRLPELDNVANAALVARKGWAAAGQVVNTWPVRRLLAWLSGDGD